MQSRGVARSARQAGTPTAIALDTTKLERRQVLVPVGRCVDLSLALGPGASGAELRVVDSKNAEQLQLARGALSTSTRICARRGELERRPGAGAVSSTTLYSRRCSRHASSRAFAYLRSLDIVQIVSHQMREVSPVMPPRRNPTAGAIR
jgi:hypothetical protein